MLLSVGHKWTDILDYTMPQFKAFCEAAEKAKRMDHAALIAAVATGAQGDGKGIKKTLDDLTKG